jgi:hypothetical protein
MFKRSMCLIAALSLVTLSGCRQKRADSSSQDAERPIAAPAGNAPGWYYFSEAGVHRVAHPSEIPARAFAPWTEAVRVTDAAAFSGAPALLVNRLGVMTVSSGGEAASFHTDPILFPAATAAGFYLAPDGPSVRFYRNSVFAESRPEAEIRAGPFLALWDRAAGLFTPLYAAADFGVPDGSQCVALDRIGSMWYASFKSERDGKVEFTYLEFPRFPERAETGVRLADVRRIDADAYQRSVRPFPYESAPEALRTLLARVPESTAISVRVHAPGLVAPETYRRDAEGAEPVSGTAWLTGPTRAALFADGTLYVAEGGATEARVLRLPPLSAGYRYTEFVLSGRTLIAAWEEQRFFETGRAGLLEVNLALFDGEHAHDPY